MKKSKLYGRIALFSGVIGISSIYNNRSPTATEQSILLWLGIFLTFTSSIFILLEAHEESKERNISFWKAMFTRTKKV